MVGPPYDADNLYGWAKLMAEMTLRAYTDETGHEVRQLPVTSRSTANGDTKTTP